MEYRTKKILDSSIKEVISHGSKEKIMLSEDASIVDMTIPWVAGPQRRKYTEE